MIVNQIMKDSLIKLIGILLIINISCQDELDSLTDVPSPILSTCSLTDNELCPDECEIFKVVEQLPRFFHTDCENFLEADNKEKQECANIKMVEFLEENIVYPKAAKESNIEGTVVIQFIVRDTIGCLSNIRIVRDIGFGCGEEVQRVVSLMPDFVIGTQRGRPVNVLFTLPYKFKL